MCDIDHVNSLYRWSNTILTEQGIESKLTKMCVLPIDKAVDRFGK